MEPSGKYLAGRDSENPAVKKLAGKIDFLSGIGYNEIGHLDLRGEKDKNENEKAKEKPI
jgi:hypothetical protein